MWFRDDDDVAGRTSDCPYDKMIRIALTNRTTETAKRLRFAVENGTVSKRDACFSWYEDKCYIKSEDYRYSNDTPSNKTKAAASGDESYTYTFQNYLVMVCISISLFFLLLKAVTYVFFGASRSFASRCNLCLSGTLFATQLVYILSSYLDVSDDVCVASSVMLHYGFIATFSWTSVLSFDMWRNIASMRIATRHDRTFVIYCFIAWGAPLVLIAICSALNWGAPWSPLSPAYGQYYCFFGKYRAYVSFFLVPMGVLLLLDLGLYIHIIIYVRRSSHLRGSKSGHQPSDVALFFKLALIMGATWFLGLLTFLNSTVIQVLTSIFTGLQGVYLFFGFKDYQYFCSGYGATENDFYDHVDEGVGWHLPSVIGNGHSLHLEARIPFHNFTVLSNGFFNVDLKVNLTDGAVKGLNVVTRRLGSCVRSACLVDLSGLLVTYIAQTWGDGGGRKHIWVKVRVTSAPALFNMVDVRAREASLNSLFIGPVSVSTTHDTYLDLNPRRLKEFVEEVERYTRSELVKILRGTYLAALQRTFADHPLNYESLL
ncbi:hypothetical protein HPB47_022911 [Ixodes persulcatus]|uniref:Uncharacterized protein n=1 Tax=Ixodes persulcatus TaxID=34615 RepID=A0AC60Q8C3_IXOPE|nr:hypothetical protein HPB47_022911 [Ixodes persulcatus]